MKYLSIIILLITVVLSSCSKMDSKDVNSLVYQKVDKEIVIDTIGGVIIIDPYRNLENLKNSPVNEWFVGQGILTDSILNEIRQENKIFNNILVEESNAVQDVIIERYIYADNGSYYILKRNKEMGIARLYFKATKDSEETILFNPETIGNGYAVNYLKISPDEKNIAIAISQKGEIDSEIFIVNINSKKVLPHSVPNAMPYVVGGINWLADSSGFFYLRSPHLDPEKKSYLEASKAFLHYIEKSASTDKEFFSIEKTPEIELTPADFPIVQTRKANPNILLGRISGNTPYNDVYYTKINDSISIENLDWQPLFKQSDQIDQYVIKDDTLFYRTSKSASNFKVCKAIIGADYSKGEILVEEKEDAVIEDFVLIKNDMYIVRVKNGVKASLIKLQDGTEKNIDLPFVAGSCSIRLVNDNLMVFISGWTQSSENYLYEPETEKFSFVDPVKSEYSDFTDFVVEEVEVESHDGTKIPLSIIRHPNTILNGKNRVKINAYGAYGISSAPFLEIATLNWVKSGNIYAVAHVRGGGEKGDTWHKGGFKMTKSNSWKDFIACTEFLIDNKYTSKNLTIASGASAGGITIANALIERPDLYHVGLLFSGFINASRSEFQPNGANSAKEFGTLAIEEEAKGLIDMDAYLKIKEDVEYPAIYAFVGLEDGQVAAWDSGKFVARLQNDAMSKGAVLLQVDEDGGHGGGGTVHDVYQILANMDSFALWQTGHPDYQLKE